MSKKYILQRFQKHISFLWDLHSHAFLNAPIQFQVRLIFLVEHTRVDRDVQLLSEKHTIHVADLMLRCVDGRHNLYIPTIVRKVNFGCVHQSDIFVTLQLQALRTKLALPFVSSQCLVHGRTKQYQTRRRYFCWSVKLHVVCILKSLHKFVPIRLILCYIVSETRDYRLIIPFRFSVPLRVIARDIQFLIPMIKDTSAKNFPMSLCLVILLCTYLSRRCVPLSV